MADALPHVLVALPAARLARDMVALTKPRITAMASLVAAGAMLLAGAIPLLDGALAVMGIAMAVAGAGVLNMLVESDVDALMERTRDRPLPSRRLDPIWALVVGVSLSGASLPILWAVGGPLPTALTAFSLFVYVFLYTPMKRKSPWALVVGAVPGAMPALMGSSVVSGRFDIAGTALFVVVFLWQLPHFLAIATYREREYTAAGHKVFPARWGMKPTKLLIACTAVLTALAGTALWPLGVGGTAFGVVAIVLGAWFVALVIPGALSTRERSEDDAWARRLFFGTLVWQTVLFASLAVDKVLG
jgi:protoheme IX farnesyltransferase